MDTYKKHFKILIIVIFIGLLCFQAGIYVGTYTTIKVGIKIMRSFVDIDIDEELVEQAILKYEDRIGNQFPLKPVK